MKHTITALLLAATTLAQANTWELPNRSGGKIVATDRPCHTKGGEGLLYVYSYINGGETLQGCWTVMDSTVLIMWDTGQMTVHAIDTFTPIEVNKPHVEQVPTIKQSKNVRV